MDRKGLQAGKKLNPRAGAPPDGPILPLSGRDLFWPRTTFEPTNVPTRLSTVHSVVHVDARVSSFSARVSRRPEIPPRRSELTIRYRRRDSRLASGARTNRPSELRATVARKKSRRDFARAYSENRRAFPAAILPRHIAI